MTDRERHWVEAEMFVLKSLEQIDRKLEGIEERVGRNSLTLSALDKELKIRSSMYGAIGSLIGAAVLKYVLGG